MFEDIERYLKRKDVQVRHLANKSVLSYIEQTCRPLIDFVLAGYSGERVFALKIFRKFDGRSENEY